MYLDTKNLTVSSNTATTTATTMTTNAPKVARRMRKVWQPLRRLLAVGGKGRPASKPHPNNVDLNNTLLLHTAEHLEQADSKATPEESLHKFELQEELALTPPPPNTPTLISSVYVEKVSAQSCNACQHGRNCQHIHHDSNTNINSSNNICENSTPAPTLWDLPLPLALPLPLQYISTDNGTFFWANTQERVDDDLLQAWLCQSFSQLPGTLC
ncbi:m2 [Drosophila busckii]|uniref:M2 n=1 Tax=Drosophila busckii TaxID=30019 RepID=A0A0M5JCI6_DROBS|nr:enhancer of split M2 protein [Drosophila busckii]ALC46744.1 m2 [Drosophila busckii]